MKKRLLCAGLLLSFLVSCAPAPVEETAAPTVEVQETPPDREPLTADAIARAVVESQPDPSGYVCRVPVDDPFGGDLAFYLELYGVDWDMVCNAAIYTADGADAREIAVITLDHGTYTYDGSSTVAALEDYRRSRLGDFFGYLPQEAALVEGGKVLEEEGWIALLICADMEKAEAAFSAAVSGEAPPAPTPERGEPDPTPTLDPRYVKDERGFLPFLPPNEVDMTLYDTSAILSAWETGEEGGLSEKDAAILAKCREVLGECITADMTDFERELALHDWLIDWGHYDQTAHDPKTPEGLPDNKNPYGMLVKGYGICLGYAVTFQLLMDLSGVECITVVGASAASSSDHAWNMVKLEGEWYCVDPTWDDTTIPHPDAYTQEELSRRHHRYFNVTSQDLRDSDHQWDYENIPEAAATRFRWDGTGTLPS